MTALLASSSFLSGCGSTSNNPVVEVPTVQETSGINIDTTTWSTIESTGIVNETTGTTESILTGTLTGTDTTTNNIKSMIEKRKAELPNETGNKKELNEKDIQLLESILNEMTKNKK